MKRNVVKKVLAMTMIAAMTVGAVGCGGAGGAAGKKMQKVDKDSLKFPLKEQATLRGMTSFPAGSESDPNKRTIFTRLEKDTNVHIDWTAVQSDQWADKIGLVMSDPNKLPDFIFSAGFDDSSLLKYGKQGVIIPVEKYIDAYMPNLKKVFDEFPEYRAMCTDSEGHIWALPWIEQLGSGKEAIQSVSDMSFINKKWLDFLGLEVPKTTDDLEKVLVAFRDNADKI